MRNLFLLAAVLGIALTLAACRMTPGGIALSVPASTDRVIEGEEMLGEAVTTNADAIVELGGAVSAIAANMEGFEDEAKAATDAVAGVVKGQKALESKADELSTKDSGDRLWFDALIAAIGLGATTYGGRKGYTFLRDRHIAKRNADPNDKLNVNV